MPNESNAKPCPSCGHCPTCGRGGLGAYPYPYYPMPWYQRPWWETPTAQPQVTWGYYDATGSQPQWAPQLTFTRSGPNG